MNPLERLEVEARDADEVLLHLVAREVREAAASSAGFDLPVEELVRLAVAVNAGLSRVIRWRVGLPSPSGLVARQAVAEAVAAESLRDRLPAVAVGLERPWRTAVRVRVRLRALGPEAEGAALRLLPSWRLPLDDLPEACAAVVATDVPRQRRRISDLAMLRG